MMTIEDRYEMLSTLQSIIDCLRDFDRVNEGSFAADVADLLADLSGKYETSLNEGGSVSEAHEIVNDIDPYVSYVIRECSSFKNIGLDIFPGKKQKIILRYIVLVNKFKNGSHGREWVPKAYTPNGEPSHGIPDDPKAPWWCFWKRSRRTRT